MTSSDTPVVRAPGEWRAETLDVGGTPVAYLHRAGVSAPVVFLHGFADAGDCYQGLVSRLPSELNIYLVDSAAHGRSGIPSDGAHEVSRRRLTVEFLRQVTGPAFVIGHSMGGATALAVAAAAPELVRGVVLEDPPWFEGELDERDAPPTMVDLEDKLIQWVLALQGQQVTQVEADRREQCPHWDDIEFAHWARAKHAAAREALAYEYHRIPESIVDQWQALTCPALLLTGSPELSGIVTTSVAEQFVAHAASGVVSHHAQAGHDVRRDDPAGVSAAIADFLDRHDVMLTSQGL